MLLLLLAAATADAVARFVVVKRRFDDAVELLLDVLVLEPFTNC